MTQNTKDNLEWYGGIACIWFGGAITALSLAFLATL